MSLLFTFTLLILSVLVGGGVVSFLEKTNKEKIIKLLLAFSGGFLLSIAFIHFLPELYHHADESIGIWILVGFLVQLILEFFSGGIEHGHIHHHHGAKIPWGVLIALGIHSFVEGIPLAAPFIGEVTATTHHHGGENTLLMGIIFHQVPVAISLMVLLLAGGIKQSKAWLIMFIFALTTPAGLVLGLMSKELIFALNFDIILALVVGMFLHISTTIIFETNENHKFNLIKLISILVGFATAIFIH
mgnify:CR=1 FL=1